MNPTIITPDNFNREIITNTIYNNDCFTVLPHINHADSIILDLPYNMTSCSFDDEIINLQELFTHLERIADDNTPIILFGKGAFTFKLFQAMLPTKFQYRQSLVWSKPQSSNPFLCKKQVLPSHEDILIFSKKAPYYSPVMETGHPSYTRDCKVGGGKCFDTGKMKQYKRENKGTRYPKSVLNYGYFNERGKYHPTLKPQALLEFLIQSFCPPSGVVLDCCAGAISTGVAALSVGREFIAVERDIEYCEVGLGRIQKVIKNVS
jgi:DNA modification methylase